VQIRHLASQVDRQDLGSDADDLLTKHKPAGGPDVLRSAVFRNAVGNLGFIHLR
jgi:hypothetical protein